MEALVFSIRCFNSGNSMALFKENNPYSLGKYFHKRILLPCGRCQLKMLLEAALKMLLQDHSLHVNRSMIKIKKVFFYMAKYKESSRRVLPEYLERETEIALLLDVAINF